MWIVYIITLEFMLFLIKQHDKGVINILKLEIVHLNKKYFK